jgi:hypothetical protein
MIELTPVRLGFFYLLVAGFLFGGTERAVAVVAQPDAPTIGSFFTAMLFLVAVLFNKPEVR